MVIAFSHELARGGQLATKVDSLLQNLTLRCLWISKVHHLIHELIDYDEIVPNGFLLEFLEVLDENLSESVEEQDCFDGIRVSF